MDEARLNRIVFKKKDDSNNDSMLKHSSMYIKCLNYL